MSDEENKNINNNKNNIFDKIIIVLLIIACLLFFIRIIKPDIIISKEKKSVTAKWTVAKGVMTKARHSAVATLLPDGNILIMGGDIKENDSAEIYNPNNQKIEKIINLSDKRTSLFATTKLKDGNILVTGGLICSTSPCKLTNTAKIFNSSTYEFVNINNMNYNTGGHNTVLLKNGNVLILHSFDTCVDADKCCPDVDKLYYEIYNPNENNFALTKNTFPPAGIAGYPINYFTLDNSNILIFTTDKRYIYNVSSNTFEEYEDNIPQSWLFVQLDSKRYLTIGPSKNSSVGYVYNIETKEKKYVNNEINYTWKLGTKPQILRLNDGNVLILGINIDAKNRKKYSAYIYDKEKNLFIEIQPPPYPVYNAGIVQANNGDIIIAGGRYKTGLDKIQILKYKY